MSVTVDLDYLYKALFAVTFGPSRQAQRIVESHLERKYPGAQHLAFEYFVHCPLKYKSEPPELEKTLKNTLSFAPFLPRIASGSLVLPDVTEDCDLGFVRPNERAMAEERFWVPFTEANFSHLVFALNQWAHASEALASWEPPSGRTPLGWEPVPKLMAGRSVASGLKLQYKLFDAPWAAASRRSKVVAVASALSPGNLRRTLLDYRRQASGALKGNNPTATSVLAGWSRMMQYGFLRSRLGWLFARAQLKIPISMLLVPIASDCLFYGFCWVLIFGVPTEELRDEAEERRAGMELANDLAVELLRHATTSYAPSLAVLHQHLIERSLDKAKNPDRGEVFRQFATDERRGLECELQWKGIESTEHRYHLPFKAAENSAFTIEKTLSAFWHATASKVTADDEPPWIFRDYVVASQKMVDLVQEICARSQGIRRSGTSLPAALVVGGAGSGKEQVASILSRLSSQFWKGDIHKINLAALKPDPLAPPTLMGLEQGVQRGDEPQQIMAVSGLFRRIRAEAAERILSTMGAKVDGEASPEEWLETTGNEWLGECPLWPTVVLDELNSLGVESQGVLLRLLENAEIVAMGAVRDRELGKLGTTMADYAKSQPLQAWLKKFADSKLASWLTNFLVVGVTNEDPDDLTRERAIQFLKDGQYLGGFLSDILYEQFVRLRRLRPDVKYRLMRGGYFRLPNLDDRREDIPILFMVHAQNELKTDPNYRGVGLWVTQEAYDVLISERVHWPGNVRQLQEVAKRAVQLATANFSNRNLSKNKSPQPAPRQFIVLAANIRDALQESVGALLGNQKES